MAVFEYQALDSKLKKINGSINGTDYKAVSDSLRQKGFTIISLRENAKAGREQSGGRGRREKGSARFPAGIPISGEGRSSSC
ncbi:hypothetical protein SDC9_184663 [bioreactor metagenome]|uniref:General secretion pathway protein F n=1 Tax=bioreactor metagenome TaxID=1076179 RepID=A0A645HDN7_9ZZZZ